MHKVIYLQPAKYDLKEIFSFIAQDNIENAGKVLLSIKASVENLGIFPFLGKKLPTSHHRLLIEAKYKYSILYTVADETVYIVSIHKKKSMLD